MKQTKWAIIIYEVKINEFRIFANLGIEQEQEQKCVLAYLIFISQIYLIWPKFSLKQFDERSENSSSSELLTIV